LQTLGLAVWNTFSGTALSALLTYCTCGGVLKSIILILSGNLQPTIGHCWGFWTLKMNNQNMNDKKRN
jgi:hypothetical protein